MEKLREVVHSLKVDNVIKKVHVNHVKMCFLNDVLHPSGRYINDSEFDYYLVPKINCTPAFYRSTHRLIVEKPLCKSSRISKILLRYSP